MAATREIQVTDLHAAFKVLDLVPSKSGIQSSDFILVDFTKSDKARFVLSSDMLGAAYAKTSGGWVPKKFYFIDRRLLTPFVASVPENEFKDDNRKISKPFVFSEMEGGKKICVQWSNRTLELALPKDDITGYGQFLPLGDLKKLNVDATLRLALAAAASCSTNDPSVPHLNSVYLHNKRVYATDNVCLFYADKADLTVSNTPFPASIVRTFANNLVTSVLHGKNHISVMCVNGRLEQAVYSDAKTKFPFSACDKHIEWAKKHQPALKFSSKAFGEVASRLAGYLSGVKREEWRLCIQGEKGEKKVKVLCTIAQGRFEEELVASVRCESTIAVEWPLDRLLSVFQYFEKMDHDLVVKVEPGQQRVHLTQVGNSGLIVAAKAG
jgi:hypothetical protein